MAYGRALMLKAGFKGSGINDLIWMGEVVNEASNLCHQGNKEGRATLQLSTCVYENLNEEHQKLLHPVCETIFHSPLQYEGNVIERNMDKWLDEQKANEQHADALLLSLLRGGNVFADLVPARQQGQWSLLDILSSTRRF
jgi:hypothetical protein